MDNIGGIYSVSFILPNEVKCISNANGIFRVDLNDGKNWKPIQAGIYGVAIKVEPQSSDAGTLYNVSGSVLIPKQYFNSKMVAFLDTIKLHGGVMRYKNSSGEYFMLGSDTFPLKCDFEIIHAGNPSGFSGCKLSFTGKQTARQRQIVI